MKAILAVNSPKDLKAKKQSKSFLSGKLKAADSENLSRMSL